MTTMISDDMMLPEYSLKSIGKFLSKIEQVVFPRQMFEHYHAQWRRVRGWLKYKEAHWLFNQAKRSDLQGDVVEIGSAWGRNTVCLGHGIKTGGYGTVYAVYSHIGGLRFREQLGERNFSSRKGFLRNLKRFDLEAVVQPIVSTSEEGLKQWHGGFICLLFVDGWHTYDAAFHDITGWGKYVIKGGVISVHDYATSSDVQRAVHDAIDELGISNTQLNHVNRNLVFFQVV